MRVYLYINNTFTQYTPKKKYVKTFILDATWQHYIWYNALIVCIDLFILYLYIFFKYLHVITSLFLLLLLFFITFIIILLTHPLTKPVPNFSHLDSSKSDLQYDMKTTSTL